MGVPPVIVAVSPNREIWTITLNRPDRRNSVNYAVAEHLYRTFLEFDSDRGARVAILRGQGAHFCAGADLQSSDRKNPLIDFTDDPISNSFSIGPLGCTRLTLSKPTIACIEGYCVAGGFELACWCDLRVCDSSATFGVFCRRFGVPLIDGGTVRLPQLIGLSRAMDMVLTGRSVDAREALHCGLVNRLADKSTGATAMGEAMKLAELLCAFPQVCMRSDRLSMIRNSFAPPAAEEAPSTGNTGAFPSAVFASAGVSQRMKTEFEYGRLALTSPEFEQGIHAFAVQKAGRGGGARDAPSPGPREEGSDRDSHTDIVLQSFCLQSGGSSGNDTPSSASAATGKVLPPDAFLQMQEQQLTRAMQDISLLRTLEEETDKDKEQGGGSRVAVEGSQGLQSML